MRNLTFILLSVVISSCVHPYYTKAKMRSYRSEKALPSADYIHISTYHFSAGQRNGSHRVITDTLDIINDMNVLLQGSLKALGLSPGELVNDKEMDILIDPKLRWQNRKLKDFLEQLEFNENTLVPIVCYNVSLEPERSGGGGLEFVYKTGNDRYMIGHELYIAFYKNGDLAYLRNVSRWDEKIVPSGTPITHEFPQEVLDTLMHMALEPLLKQIEDN
jgi:hypothetical protein